MPTKHDDNRMVSVTLYLPDYSRQSKTGYECYSVTKWEWVYRSFFNAYRTGYPLVEYDLMDDVTCWQMVKNRRSPSPYNEKMDNLEGGIVGTSNNLVIESQWWWNVTKCVTNFYFREVMVSVYDLDGSILTTTDLKTPCFYNESWCLTTFGVLVWKPSDFKTCRLTEVGTTGCLMSIASNKTRLTCPELQISLHGVSQKEMCNLTFGTTHQGYFFLQEDDLIVHENISHSQMAANKITSPLKRERREVNAKANNMDIFNNGKYGFLYDNLKNSVEHAFQIVHHDICNTNFLLWTTLISVAKIGYPSLLVQTLYQDKSLRASFSGDALSVWKCKPIFTYKFVKREQCLFEYPIMYLEDGKQHSSFIMPFSHAIIGEAVEMPEPCGEFFFDAKDYYLQLTNDGPVKVNLPYLPQPILGTKNITIPDISFHTGSGINISGFADYMHMLTMLREIAIKNLAVRKTMDRAEIKEAEVGIFDVVLRMGSGVLGSAWSVWTYFSYVKSIIITR